jgi:ABC-type dipeptide/oligopeptide/nickel transport system permease component
MRVWWRVFSFVPTLFGVIFLTFLITRILPGDPAVFLASNPSMSADDVEQIRERLGLDASLIEQFRIYLTGLAKGDLGKSMMTGQSVATEMLHRLPASVELTLFAFSVALFVAIPLGVMAASRPGSWIDQTCRVIATLGVTIPTFVTGLLLIYVFYYRLGVAPVPIGRLDGFQVVPPVVTGMITLDALLAGDPKVAVEALGKLVLPGLCMAIFAVAPIARMTRSSMLQVLESDFIQTARANGLSRWTILISYGFRNAMLPVLTSLGMVMSYMLGSNVLVEKVFAWPGIGAFALDSVISLDYAPLQAFMLIMAGIFLFINLIIDLVAEFVDPRARLN